MPGQSMIERGAVAGLNHLLAQQRWAAERLAPFAGQSVEFHCAPFPGLRLRILDTGLVERAKDAAAGALIVKLKPGGLPLLLARDEAALKQVAIEGSAELASTVQFLFRHLDWDIEEDLSRLVGDVLAHRLATGGRAFAAWQREAATRLAENFAEYWTEEQPLLARPADVAKFRAGVDALRDDAARLEKRIESIEKREKR
ncbi:MAG: sterol-binding protein [Burkholderiales bacterium]